MNKKIIIILSIMVLSIAVFVGAIIVIRNKNNNHMIVAQNNDSIEKEYIENKPKLTENETTEILNNELIEKVTVENDKFQVNTITETKSEDEINSIKYDMKIKYHYSQGTTGLATNIYYDLVDLEAKIAYLIYDRYVFGETSDESIKGHNYNIKVMELTDNDIEKLKKYSKKESKDELKNDMFSNYVVIEYENKEVYMNRDEFQFSYDNVFNFIDNDDV